MVHSCIGVQFFLKLSFNVESRSGLSNRLWAPQLLLKAGTSTVCRASAWSSSLWVWCRVDLCCFMALRFNTCAWSCWKQAGVFGLVCTTDVLSGDSCCLLSSWFYSRGITKGFHLVQTQQALHTKNRQRVWWDIKSFIILSIAPFVVHHLKQS